MTQAITNFDKINNLISKTETNPVSADANVQSKIDTDKTASNSFDTILDKTVEKESFTLGDIKNSDSDGDMSEKIENFKEILAQATREENMEKSLDLTLARDINEIINQLQSAISSEYDILSNDYTETFEISANEVQSEVIAEDTSLLDVADPDIEICSEKVTLSPDDSDIEKSSVETSLNLDEDMLSELNIESVSSETDNSNNESASQKETPEEFGIKVMLNQAQEKFDTVIKTTVVKSTEISADKIIEQITKHMDSLKTTSKVNIVLNPESLGKVNLQIINSKDGLSAQFTVATNDVKDLLMKGLDTLKESLMAQGVGVDNISVKVSETEESTYNPDWLEQGDSEKNSQEQNRQNKDEKEKGLFEKTISKSLKNENGKV